MLNLIEELIWLKEHLPKPFPLILGFNLYQFSSLALVLGPAVRTDREKRPWWMRGEKVREQEKIFISSCCCGLCPMSCLLSGTTLGEVTPNSVESLLQQK